MQLKIEYFEHGGGASIMFGWMYVDDSDKQIEAFLNSSIVDRAGNVITKDKSKVALRNNQKTEATQKINIKNPKIS